MLNADDAQRLYWSGRIDAEALWPGVYNLYRFGPIVVLTASNVRPQSAGTATVLQLPSGYRPASTVQSVAVEDGALRPIFAMSYSPFRVEVRDVKLINSWMNFTIMFPTNDSLPGM